MSDSIINATYSKNGKLYAGMKKEDIRTQIDVSGFKTENKRERAYNKSIQLFDYADGLVDGVKNGIISEEEIIAYDKKEKQKRTRRTIGLVALGIGLTIAAVVAHKKLKGKIFSNSNPNMKKLTFKDIKEVKLSDIVPVHETEKGTYYRYINSTPIKNFDVIAGKIDYSRGLSTQPSCGGVFLRGTADIPLGTSGVGNCAVIYLQNSQKGTHAIYHAAPIMHNPIKIMEEDIKLVMQEGFDRAIIIPGRHPETAKTVQNLFETAKKINRYATIEFKHTDMTGLVEFISYKSDIFCTVLKDSKALFPVQNCYEYEAMLRKLST